MNVDRYIDEAVRLVDRFYDEDESVAADRAVSQAQVYALLAIASAIVEVRARE